jgi:hypothetical protein
MGGDEALDALPHTLRVRPEGVATLGFVQTFEASTTADESLP